MKDSRLMRRQAEKAGALAQDAVLECREQENAAHSIWFSHKCRLERMILKKRIRWLESRINPDYFTSILDGRSESVV